MTTFKEFSKLNKERCESDDGFEHPMHDWDANKWMVALFGEIGEAANKLKKLNRTDKQKARLNKGMSDAELIADLIHELGDAVVYLDLLAQHLGFDLEYITRVAFNAKSMEIDSPYMI